MVDTHDDAVVDTTAYDGRDTNHGLIGWLSSVFDANDWHPECLIVVGPDVDLTGFAKRLEYALDIPVFAPPEAELALARGAALASAQNPEFTFGGCGHTGAASSAGGRSWPRPYTAALTMLAVGVLSFVVSVSLVVGLKLTSSGHSTVAPAEQQAAKPPA